MDKQQSRRKILKMLTVGMAASGVGCSLIVKDRHQDNAVSPTMKNSWSKTFNRTWLGGEYWANPMEDWHILDGWAECKNSSGSRTVHSLTHRVQHVSNTFKVSVVVQAIGDHNNEGGFGFRLGVRNEIDEYRSNCFVQQGLDVGIIGNHLSIEGKTSLINRPIGNDEVELSLTATPQVGVMILTLTAKLVGGNQTIGQLTQMVSADKVVGNIAVVSNFALRSNAPKTGNNRYRFSHWQMSGDAFDIKRENKFGPILWSMYTLNNTRTEEGYVLKLSAFTGPMGKKDSQHIELQIKQEGSWISIEKSQLDTDVWVASFRIPNWNENKQTQYRVIYRERHNDGSETPDIWEGKIIANPSGRPLRMAALTCQNDYSFPYAPVAKNVKTLSPDLVYFSGDQIYESHGGFGIIRAPFESAMTNYLRKFYQFGWAFREIMKDCPTVCLPDDHDVLQGNLWGKGGAKKNDPENDPTASLTGGYFHTVRFVNAVHRSCTSHHPDPIDPTPNASGISCYYGEMVYGNVGFAILADRQWKNGPEQANAVVGVTGVGEDPQFINPAINPSNAQLLGERQEQFLEQWATDWREHSLKVVLSQTVFAGISTHQPTPDRYLKYDFDSDGWPGPARDRAVSIIRKSMALHICGDTHLGSLAQYGVEQQRDSNWSFCTPAISAGWPRWWLPDEIGLPHKNRPKHGLAETGEYIDAFGNKVYVYAIDVPEVGKSKNRYVKAHEKGSGFGFVTIDTEQLTYSIQAFRYLIDVADGNPNNQLPGWPVTIHQRENIGENRIS